jgi:hypothetical protein
MSTFAAPVCFSTPSTKLDSCRAEVGMSPVPRLP